MTVSEMAAKIIDEAGAAGGIDEVRALAEHGWPETYALDVGDLDEAAVRVALQARAKAVIAQTEHLEP